MPGRRVGFLCYVETRPVQRHRGREVIIILTPKWVRPRGAAAPVCVSAGNDPGKNEVSRHDDGSSVVVDSFLARC